MKKINKICYFCKNEFQNILWKNSCSNEKYCSARCQRAGRPMFKWSNATSEEIDERISKYFEKNVVKSDGCWDWLGATASGYGIMKGKSPKNIKIHRYSWEKKFGPISDGLYVCHKCDNKKCSNPDHLFLGTHLDNIKDMFQKRRNKGAPGSTNSHAIFSEKDIRSIRDHLLNGISIKELSDKFNVSFGCIYNIKIRKTWKHI